MNDVSKKYIESINYLEFINNLEDIFYDLLYSSQRGYINLHSKNAILEFSNFLEKFDWEVVKITEKIDYSNLSQIIEAKKEEFKSELRKHFDEEIKIWAQEVFDNLIQNLLFDIGLNKQDNKKLNLIYNRALSAVVWLCDIKKYNQEDKKALITNLNNEFQRAFNSSFAEFAPKQRTLKSDSGLFLKIFTAYRQNYEEFMQIDFETTLNGISQEDLIYFNNLKTKSKTSQKTVQDDEIDLINCSLEILNLPLDNQKYQFIKLLLNDFNNFQTENKSLKEEDKISLAKRRMELFKDSISDKRDYKYYKKLLIS